MPFIRVTGDSHTEFEENVQTNLAVKELLVLGKIDTSGL